MLFSAGSDCGLPYKRSHLQRIAFLPIKLSKCPELASSRSVPAADGLVEVAGYFIIVREHARDVARPVRQNAFDLRRFLDVLHHLPPSVSPED